MTAERCPRCDRPKLWTCPDGDNDCRCAERFPDHCLKGEDCDANAVDWRARALAAEAELARERSVAMDVVADAQTGREYVRRAARRLWDAQDIARRALVEGLAECERLRRLVPFRLPTSDEAQAAMDELMRQSRPQSTVRRVLRRRGPKIDDAIEPQEADEHAIRADAARAERERVVAWLRSDRWEAGPEIADAIERGEHAPGKGGEG